MVKTDKSVSLLLIILLFISLSCGQQQQTAEQLLNSLPQVHPGEISRFQHSDSVYFAHLGYTTIPFEDGSVLIYDGKNSVLVKVGLRGTIKQHYARPGRGPGEIRGILSMAKLSGGKVYVYDQMNKKLIVYGPDGNFITEYIPPPFEEGQITTLYPSRDTLRLPVRISSFRFLSDKTVDPYFFLGQYNIKENKFENVQKLKGRRYARLIIDGKIRGGTEVSFSPHHIVAKSLEEEVLYTYWTGSPHIAELSSNFDTLRTIPVDLPSQQLNSAGRDSIKKEKSPEQWDTLSELLPDKKVPVEQMKLDYRGRFWLKLNYRADSDLWLIMDQEGTPQKIVHLPEGSMVTHISKKHLGVRLDDITFALYEAVN